MSKNALLWRISGGDSIPYSYICGTMHVKDELAFQYIDQIKEIMPSLDQVFTEIALSAEANLGMQDRFYLPEGKQLSDYIGDKKYQKYRAMLLKSFDLDIEAMRFFKPIIIANTIAESLMNSDHAATLDFTLYYLAQEQNKAAYGLENIEEHYDILDRIPINEQFRQLKSIAGNPAKYRYQLNKLLEAFEQADLHKLYMLSKDSLKEIKKIMLQTRNEKMLDRMLHELPKFKSLFAVGAAHLGGAYGLLRALKAKGYSLTAV